MRKFWIFSGLLAIFALSASGQLKVVNNFGQGLSVENGGKVIFIPDKGAATFPTRIRTATLSCWTVDSKIKFVINREVSRAGIVKIEASDGTNVVVQTNPTVYTNASNAPVSQTVNTSENSQSLAAILNGSYEPTAQQVNQVEQTQLTVQTQTVVAGEAVTIEYSGSKTLKIVSSEGHGLELIGKNDSTYSVDKNKYTIFVNKGADLILGVVEKKQAGQTIWPYGELRKSKNQNDQNYKITDADVKMMCTSENRKLKFKVEASGYKILIETDAGDIISLGDKGTSKTVDGPIGQSYVRIAYTDASGEFHPTAFMPIHITSQDRYIIINQNALKKKLEVINF